MELNVLSIDVEEYYHAEIFRAGTQGLPRHQFASRVEHNVDQTLALLRRHDTLATFFVLGEVAAAHPSLVRAIAREGHEIACHGNRHENVHHQTPMEFRADVRRAKAQLEDLVGVPVIGYRAPNFSIGPAQAWAYPILVEAGYRYDSSLYPILHDRYGQPDAPRFPYDIWRNGSAALVEFPIGTTQLLNVNLPIGGGGFFRLLPFAWTRLGIHRVNTREGQPVMFYFHPWELDPHLPRPPMPWRHRLRHYVGIDKEVARLSRLLARFRFGTARDVLRRRGLADAAVRPEKAVRAS